MRKLTAKFLLFVFLVGAIVPMQAREDLVNLSFLLQHYEKHTQQFPETTFWQYLNLHYGDAFLQHKAAHDHSNLPLKNKIDHLHAPAPMLLCFGLEQLSRPVDCFGDQPEYPNTYYTLIRPQDIWQPPKLFV